MLETLFNDGFLSGDKITDNLYVLLSGKSHSHNEQKQTASAFSNKWELYDYDNEDFEAMVKQQKSWYLQLYGFESEEHLADYLKGCQYVLDAGCGTGYKAAWFAELSPSTQVIAVDLSESVYAASKQYQELSNLLFIQADIGSLSFVNDNCFDYVSCDQVIHHTKVPFDTAKELHRITKPMGGLSLYVYRKKALPRELLDEHFRTFSQSLDHDQLMSLSSQLTQLGKLLDENGSTLHFPDIPILGIKGGQMTIQRFIYWNFIKCFWNSEQGEVNSTMINYDWYSPSQATRYSKSEFMGWIEVLQLQVKHFHEEMACYSGRFIK